MVGTRLFKTDKDHAWDVMSCVWNFSEGPWTTEGRNPRKKEQIDLTANYRLVVMGREFILERYSIKERFVDFSTRRMTFGRADGKWRCVVRQYDTVNRRRWIDHSDSDMKIGIVDPVVDMTREKYMRNYMSAENQSAAKMNALVFFEGSWDDFRADYATLRLAGFIF